MASQRYKGHSLLVTSPQTSLVMVVELGSPRMEDSLPGHRPPQQAARKSCETIVEFKNNHSQREAVPTGGPRTNKSTKRSCLVFSALVCAFVHEPGDIAAGRSTLVNGFQSFITSKPAPPSSICSWLVDGVASAWLSCHQSTGLIMHTLSAVVG